MLCSLVDFPALLHLRRSYASRSADFAAPHLNIMPQLHLDALHAAASVLRINESHACFTLSQPSCTSSTRAAASRVQHCSQRHSLLIVSLSYNPNKTCAAGAPTPPAPGASPVSQLSR